MTDWRDRISKEAGAFCVFEGPMESGWYFAFTCPCGCGDQDIIPIKKGPQENAGHRWGWDGNVEAPTLTPSIQRNTPCQWHGYMRAGKFVLQ